MMMELSLPRSGLPQVYHTQCRLCKMKGALRQAGRTSWFWFTGVAPAEAVPYSERGVVAV
jgi:hypothetical protein